MFALLVIQTEPGRESRLELNWWVVGKPEQNRWVTFLHNGHMIRTAVLMRRSSSVVVGMKRHPPSSASVCQRTITMKRTDPTKRPSRPSLKTRPWVRRAWGDRRASRWRAPERGKTWVKPPPPRHRRPLAIYIHTSVPLIGSAGSLRLPEDQGQEEAGSERRELQHHEGHAQLSASSSWLEDGPASSLWWRHPHHPAHPKPAAQRRPLTFVEVYRVHKVFFIGVIFFGSCLVFVVVWGSHWLNRTAWRAGVFCCSFTI